ncbi:tyrosine-type recombinase/integrase [Candidatus Woesearchaeota archaeon]|nr:tyrosine-type recombinase/integrase [Candidatus Woesearchaeota archaeon]
MYMYIVDRIKKEAYRRRLSHKTTKAYIFWIKRFLKFSKKSHQSLTKKDVRLFIEQLSEKGLAGNTLNVALASINFFVEWVLNKRWKLSIRYSKTPKTIAVFLTRQEIIKLFSAVQNQKHKLMLALMYSAGLRVSELVHLKVSDLQVKEGYGWVRQGKGNKDRVFIIAARLKEELVEWAKGLDKNSYLFLGNNNCHITVRTVQEIIKSNAKKAGIRKNVHPHTLRHSFATHIAEKGHASTVIQGLLGHVSPETSLQYIHSASPKMFKVKSPYDEL